MSVGTDQDQQLDIIGRGVANLKNYSVSVKNESELHVRLLNEIDDDVTRAATGLESEGARAAKVGGSQLFDAQQASIDSRLTA